jgi:hypothetical protein
MGDNNKHMRLVVICAMKNKAKMGQRVTIYAISFVIIRETFIDELTFEQRPI